MASVANAITEPRAHPTKRGCAVTLRRLTKAYEEGGQKRPVIRRAEACISPGEFVVLVGPSGCGKTTLLNLICGIDTPTDGEVLIDDTPITALSETARTLFRRKHIGFVFQFFNLIDTLSVEENLLLPLSLNGFGDAAAHERITTLLSEVGLAERRSSFPDSMSGGEQQRIAIARALAHDPPLLLADEPTGNLDAATGEAILALLERLVRGSGKTMIIVTHDDSVIRIADRVLAMQDGCLMEHTPQSQ